MNTNKMTWKKDLEERRGEIVIELKEKIPDRRMSYIEVIPL